MGFRDFMNSLGLSQIMDAVAAPRDMPDDLARSGLMGTAVVLGMTATGVSLGGTTMPSRVVTFDLEIHVAGVEPYVVTTNQAVPGLVVGGILPGATVFVRVDPTNPLRVAIDFEQIIPGAGQSAGTGQSAAALLASGVSGTAEVQQTFSVGAMRAPNGDPVLGLIMTVTYGNAVTVTSRNGQRIPQDQLASVVPGRRFAVKGDPAVPDRVAIDWDHSTQ